MSLIEPSIMLFLPSFMVYCGHVNSSTVTFAQAGFIEQPEVVDFEVTVMGGPTLAGLIPSLKAWLIRFARDAIISHYVLPEQWCFRLDPVYHTALSSCSFCLHCCSCTLDTVLARHTPFARPPHPLHPSSTCALRLPPYPHSPKPIEPVHTHVAWRPIMFTACNFCCGHMAYTYTHGLWCAAPCFCCCQQDHALCLPLSFTASPD